MKLLANQPKGVLALTILETADVLVYFGLLVSLVLFLVDHIHLDIHQAYMLYGIYLTLIYSLPLLGGYLTDRFIGAHRAILYGAILIDTRLPNFGISWRKLLQTRTSGGNMWRRTI